MDEILECAICFELHIEFTTCTVCGNNICIDCNNTIKHLDVESQRCPFCRYQYPETRYGRYKRCCKEMWRDYLYSLCMTITFLILVVIVMGLYYK